MSKSANTLSIVGLVHTPGNSTVPVSYVQLMQGEKKVGSFIRADYVRFMLENPEVVRAAIAQADAKLPAIAPAAPAKVVAPAPVAPAANVQAVADPMAAIAAMMAQMQAMQAALGLAPAAPAPVAPVVAPAQPAKVSALTAQAQRVRAAAKR
jgi:hypothetical protein